MIKIVLLSSTTERETILKLQVDGAAREKLVDDARPASGNLDDGDVALSVR